MMESFAVYLFKSAVWLSGFSLVYFLFLRNERFFRIKRGYLIAGILASFLLPLITLHYTKEFPAPQVLIPAVIADPNGNLTTGGLIAEEFRISYKHVLLFIYILGILTLSVRIIKQILVLTGIIRKSNYSHRGLAKIVRVHGIKSPFSFLNYVFISPSMEPDDAEQILNHEEEHIRQKHWLDLMLAEIIRLLQWANPVVWIYTGFIRQNHEYLADIAALQQTPDPSRYRAVLLNQMFNVPVIPLSNSFSCSNSKKRFDMMEKIISSPYRKLRILFILPMAALIFYAFATPEYNDSSIFPDGTVRGTVSAMDGKPLAGATVLVKGTTIGTISDNKGSFRLENVPGEASMIVTFIGYKTKTVKPDFISEMTIKLLQDTVNLSSIGVPPPPPPPPPADRVDKYRSENGEKPHFVVEREKGKNWDVLITTNDNSAESNKKEVPSVPENKNAMVLVEEMPMFVGGEAALQKYIYSNIKAGIVDRSQLKNPVIVVFVVSKTGKINNVRVTEPVHPILDTEAVRVVSSMPDWIPGKQNGTPVDVIYKLPINFNPVVIKTPR